MAFVNRADEDFSPALEMTIVCHFDPSEKSAQRFNATPSD